MSKIIKKFNIYNKINESSTFDLGAALDASFEDGYEEMKSFLNPKHDFDFKRLYDKGNFMWETEKSGDIFCSLEKGNVWTVTCRTDDDYFGKCSTHEHDEVGLAYCVMSALRDLKSDYDSTFKEEK